MVDTYPISEDSELREFKLKLMEYQTQLRFGGFSFDSLTISKQKDLFSDELIYKVTVMIPAEDIKTDTRTLKLTCPEGWWDAFKEHYFPAWLIKRYLIKYKTKEETVTFTAYNLYPKFPVVYPGCGYGRWIIVQYLHEKVDNNV